MKLKSLVISVVYALLALPCHAGTELGPEGRRIATGPKSVQQSLDGVDLQLIERHAPTPARRLGRAGRALRAGPTQPVSVGISGCPGCGSEAIVEGLRLYVVAPGRR